MITQETATSAIVPRHSSHDCSMSGSVPCNDLSCSVERNPGWEAMGGGWMLMDELIRHFQPNTLTLSSGARAMGMGHGRTAPSCLQMAGEGAGYCKHHIGCAQPPLLPSPGRRQASQAMGCGVNAMRSRVSPASPGDQPPGTCQGIDMFYIAKGYRSFIVYCCWELSSYGVRAAAGLTLQQQCKRKRMKGMPKGKTPRISSSITQ